MDKNEQETKLPILDAKDEIRLWHL